MADSDHIGCLGELLSFLPDLFAGRGDEADYLGLGLVLLGIAALGGGVCGLWYWITRVDLNTSPLFYCFFLFGIVGITGILFIFDGWRKSRDD